MTSGVAPWVLDAVGGGTVGHTLTLEKVADERVLGRGGFVLTSAAFRHGGELDPSFTAIEEDAVAPPLEWTPPPPGAPRDPGPRPGTEPFIVEHPMQLQPTAVPYPYVPPPVPAAPGPP